MNKKKEEKGVYRYVCEREERKSYLRAAVRTLRERSLVSKLRELVNKLYVRLK